MEIIITNKKLKELAKINNAQNVDSFTYSGTAKYKFISFNKNQLVKSILYVDYENNYYLMVARH